VRLSGQDCKRGTFSHRHCVVKDQNSEKQYCSLNTISSDNAFEVINSALSEYAVLGYEYGYSITDPKTLVLWEAQFGDFSNGAQIIIDQFISSAEEKWMRVSGLVMLLPHAYEGQGPEHSSARLERYLQLCAQNNMQVVNCTTPANYFHVLRRQMHRNYRKPLIIVTPKSLLRHKLAVSNIEDFTDKSGGFKHVIDDTTVNKSNARKVVLCSGKVYYDLLEANKINDVALIRIEQYYPFPQQQLIEVIKHYSNAKEIVWCQEEPKNQGAWFCIRAYLEVCLSEAKKGHIAYVGRPEAASTAAGYAKMHKLEQDKLIKEALS
jgi:2-oxoglutarate dehydrogenase E1 component